MFMYQYRHDPDAFVIYIDIITMLKVTWMYVYIPYRQDPDAFVIYIDIIMMLKVTWMYVYIPI